VAFPILPDCKLDDDTLTEVAKTNGKAISRTYPGGTFIR
jgi:hypothetical protein